MSDQQSEAAPERQVIRHGEVAAVPGFAGRAAELAAIDELLWTKGTAVALVDGGARDSDGRKSGGIGKSALARQYAWDNRERYAGIWWVRARSRQSVAGDLVELGRRLMPELAAVGNRGRAALLTLDALSQAQGERPWLVVYDDAATPEMIAGLIPAAGAHVLVTSPTPDWKDHAEAIPVGLFPRTLAMDYMLTHARGRDAAAAGRLADELGRLPLALAIARETCWSMGLDFDACRIMLPDVARRAPKDAAYPAPLYAVLDLALKQAIENAPSAERLLGIAAFLASDRVPLDLVTDDAMPAAQRDAGAAALAGVALAAQVADEDGRACLSLHPLVQAAMRDRLGPKGAREQGGLAAELLVQALALGAPISEATEPPADGRNLEEHAIAVMEHRPDDAQSAATTALLLKALGRLQKASGEVASAERSMRHAIAVGERANGPDHPDVAAALGDLGRLLQETGRREEAEPAFRRAIEIEEAAFGAEHPTVADRLAALAALLHDTGRLDEAERLTRRALSITEVASGLDHADVAARLDSLAQILAETGRTDEAMALMKRALSISEKCHGPADPDVAFHLANLGVLLASAGRSGEAEPVLRRALAIDEAALGADHPRVGLDLGNLADLLRREDRLDEALVLARRALAIDEAAFEPEHARVAERYNTVAILLAETGRPADADPYVRHAVIAAERALGPDHPETIAFRQNYDDIIAAVEAIAERDDAVEAGRAPPSAERLARADLPPPPSRPRSSVLERLRRKRV